MFKEDKKYAVKFEYMIDDKVNSFTLGRYRGYGGVFILDLIKDVLKQNKDVSIRDVYEVETLDYFGAIVIVDKFSKDKLNRLKDNLRVDNGQVVWYNVFRKLEKEQN